MKKASILFLKTVILIAGIATLGICLYLIPALFEEDDMEFVFLLLGIMATETPFLIGLFHANKILTYVDKNMAFSDLSVKSLKFIKYCSIIICGIYISILPFMFYIAETDDAPGAAALGLVFVGATFVTSVAAALLERLVKDAIELKSENDLTV
jgi:hypothetical protein